MLSSVARCSKSALLIKQPFGHEVPGFVASGISVTISPGRHVALSILDDDDGSRQIQLDLEYGPNSTYRYLGRL